jgi:Helix-turn-helix.
MKYKFNNKLMRSLREKKGWSQRELAEKANITTAGVCVLEGMGRAPSMKTFCKLCKALEVTPNKFLS